MEGKTNAEKGGMGIKITVRRSERVIGNRTIS